MVILAYAIEFISIYFSINFKLLQFRYISKQTEQSARIGKIFARWLLAIAITSKYSYFYSYFLFFVFVFFIFPLLIARDKSLFFYNRAILSLRYHKFIFLSVVFSLRTKRVTSQHNL